MVAGPTPDIIACYVTSYSCAVCEYGTKDGPPPRLHTHNTHGRKSARLVIRGLSAWNAWYGWGMPYTGIKYLREYGLFDAPKVMHEHVQCLNTHPLLILTISNPRWVKVA